MEDAEKKTKWVVVKKGVNVGEYDDIGDAEKAYAECDADVIRHVSKKFLNEHEGDIFAFRAQS